MNKNYNGELLEFELLDLPQFEEYTFWEQAKKRNLIINSIIDDSLVERVIMQIIKINGEDKDLPRNKRKPINIFINTCGGAVDVGMALCSTIKTSITPVNGIVLGKAYSMGGLILLACHKRMAYEFSTILLHDGSLEMTSSSKKAKDTMAFYDKLEVKIRNFVINNSKITEEKYDEMYGNEWYMFSDEAKGHGIIDEIIGCDNN